jgi:ABC-type multidrug transport system ATPase subunit
LILSTEGINKHFFRNKALQDIHMTVPEYATYILLGLNGAGKSTLINILSGFFTPTAGNIKFMEKDITNNKKLLFHHMGTCPQEGIIDPDFSIALFFYYAARLKRISRETAYKQMKDICEILNLDESLDRKMGHLSFGKQKLTAIAQAFLGSPKLVLLDEPFEGLDSNHRKLLTNFIKSFSKHTTLVIASHIIEELDDLATHIGILHKSKLIFEGQMKALTQPDKTLTITLLDKNTEIIEKIKRIEGVLSITQEMYTIYLTTEKDVSQQVMNLLYKENIFYKSFYKGKRVQDIFHEYIH